MVEEIHIVYGEIGKAILLQSNCVDFSSSDRAIILLKDNLTEGPLFDLKTQDRLSDRIGWFEEFYNASDSYHMREESARKVGRQLCEIRAGCVVYIWLGNEGNEYVWKSAVLNFLQDVAAAIFVIDWGNIWVEGKFGKFNPYSLYVCAKDQVSIVNGSFSPLSDVERLHWSNIWAGLYKNNSSLRVLKENKVIESDVSFYDEMVLAHCTDEFQRSTYVVGLTLGYLYSECRGAGVGDMFLFERVRQLANQGVLEITNQQYGPSCGHLFDVRRVKGLS